MKIKKISLIMILSAAVFACGCSAITITKDKNAENGITISTGKPVTISETKHETKEVEPQGAESITTEINFGAGKLNINGDADKLMKAEFTYNVPEWKPIVDYKVSGKEGTLSLNQPSNSQTTSKDVKYQWDVSLNNKTPMNIRANLGTGITKFDFSKLNLKDVDIQMGVANMDINLCGNYKNDVTVNIEGGVGNATIFLPKDTGVNVEVEKGVGKVNANGFTINDNSYTNNAYGKSQYNINVKVQTGVGNINLKLK